MLSAALLLLCNSLFLSLHLTGSAGSFPKPLSAARERECLERCAAGDLEARNILVEHNLRLVAHIIKKYYTQSTDQEDLISIGTIGLIKAVNTFRPDKGIKLATYAARCIENTILRSHFQLHQHHAHAVKDPKTVNFSVSVGIFKAACLTDRAGTDIGFVMVSNVNDGQHRLSPMECHAPVPMPAFTPCSPMCGWLRSRGGQYPGVSVCTLPETALLPEMPDGRRGLLPQAA